MSVVQNMRLDKNAEDEVEITDVQVEDDLNFEGFGLDGQLRVRFVCEKLLI